MKILKRFLLFLTLLIALIWLYTNSLIGVNKIAKDYLKELKIELKNDGLNPNIFVISGRRWKLDNYILTKISGAASKSQHLHGNAIDIIVLDVNRDGKIDKKDVNLVYAKLDKVIIKNNGGLGTYKKESGFFNRQMIHFDCRGKRSRWNR